jgi:hypothetical protein
MNIYIYNENFNIEIFKKHIKNNQPCLIKNFLTNNINDNNLCNENNVININSKYKKCSLNSFISFIKNLKLTCVDHGCFNNNNNNNKLCCDIKFLENLINDNNYFFKDTKRYWIHNKNNFTRNHYDGNGIEIINICLQGKKKFYLASPEKKFTMIPLSNLSLIKNPNDSNYDYIIDVNIGDLLYIPSYWWHKVLTLENESININFNFYCCNHKLSERQKNIYALHKLTNSSFTNDNIYKFINLDTVSFYSLIKLFIKECNILILLILYLGYFCSDYNIINIIFILFILNLISKCIKLDFKSYGYSTMIIHYFIPIFIFSYMLGKYKHLNRK